MPKRIIDGDALWKSKKLLQVEPESFRPEFANLIPLALANGTFECDARVIWSHVYSYNRPTFTPQMVNAMLDELERVKILFRWKTPDGGTWGTWVGNQKPGRLPSRSDIKKGEKVGAEIPQDLLRKFLESPQGFSAGNDLAVTGRTPGGDSAHGFGVGSGFGNGSGMGSGSVSGYGPSDGGGAGGEAPALKGQEDGGTTSSNPPDLQQRVTTTPVNVPVTSPASEAALSLSELYFKLMKEPPEDRTAWREHWPQTFDRLLLQYTGGDLAAAIEWAFTEDDFWPPRLFRRTGDPVTYFSEKAAKIIKAWRGDVSGRRNGLKKASTKKLESQQPSATNSLLNHI